MADRARWHGAVRAFVLITLGAVTTLGMIAWSATRVPANSRGIVDSSGEHLKPWVIQVHSLLADRIVFFEKARIYSAPGSGPAGARSCAVSCWSFATSARSNPGFAPATVELPAELRGVLEEKLASGHARYWGLMQERRGFPFRGAECTVVAPDDPAAPGIWEARGGAVVEDARAQTSASLFSLRVIPYRPLWPGLMGNVLVWGVAWWCGWGVVTGVRRALSRKRGHCPKCGYDLRGSVGRCSECGWELTAAVIMELKPGGTAVAAAKEGGEGAKG